MSQPPDSNSTASSADAPSHPRRRRRWLRWLIVLAVLLLLIIVAVQAVLWSSIPKSLVIDALQKALGVKVEAETVATGWWGSTRVENVAMTIPLEEQPFVKTGTIRVKHSSLIELVIFGLELESLDIDSPSVYARQSPSGRWNILDQLQSMGASSQDSSGTGGGGGGGPSERPKIPAINIHNATLHVTDNKNRTSTVGPLMLGGRPSDTAPGLVWDYNLLIPQQLTVEGRVVLGGDWRHEAKINVQDLAPLMTPFVGKPPDLKLAARWEGHSAGGVQGRLSIEQMTVQGIGIKGALGLGVAGGKLAVTPENLAVLDDQQQARATLVGGQVVFDSGEAKLDTVVARGPGIDLIANATFATATRTGELSLDWRATAAPAGLRHAGTLVAKLDRTFDGRVEATASLQTHGHMTDNSARNWAGRVEVSAAGPELNELAVTVQTPQFKLVGPRRTVVLDGLVASLYVSEQLGDRPGGVLQGSAPGLGVALQSMRLRDTERFSANGFFLVDSQQWALSFVGKDLPIPKLAPDALGVSVEAAGDSRIIHLQSVRVAAGDSMLQATGSYVRADPQPLVLKVDLDHVPPATDLEAKTLGGEETTPPLLEGLLSADGTVTGTVDPLKLTLTGEVQGVNVHLLQRDLGNLSVKVEGYADAHRAQLWRDPDGPPLSILGGTWELEAIHDLDQEATTLTIGFENLPLKEVGDFVNDPTLSGTAFGDWAIYVPTYRDVKNQVRAGGKLEAVNLVAAGYELDSLEAWTVVDDGRAGFEPLVVRRQEGVFTAKPSVALEDLKNIEIADLRLEQWPLALPPSTYLTVNASAPRVAVHLGNPPKPRDPKGTDKGPIAAGMRFESGPITLHSTVQLSDIDAGTVRMNAVLDNRVIDVRLLTATLFDSRLEARASANLDEPNNLTASFVLEDVNPERLRKLVPALEALSGSFDVRGAVGPVSGPDAMEPLGTDLFLTSRDVLYRPNTGDAAKPSPGIRIGDGRFQAQMRLDSKFQLERAILSDQSGIMDARTDCPPARNGPLPVNTLEAAGGVFSLWGRAVRNENDRKQPGLTTLTSHLRIGFRCLNLDQILQAYKPDDEPVPGEIDGSVVLYGTSGLVRTPVRRDDLDQAVDVKPPNPVTPAVTQPTSQTATAPAGVIDPNLVAPPVATGDAESFLTSILLAMQGEGQLRIRKSDLGNIDAISFLYNAMRLGQGSLQPTGSGELSFRVENGDVYLSAFRYFNRGVDVRAVGTVFNLQRLQKAPVRATAYGSVRALANVELPIVRSVVPDLDRLISALQQGGTSIDIGGTLGQPKMRVVLFEELGKSMRELLIGDFNASKRPPPR